MKTTKLSSFTLKTSTTEMLSEYAEIKSVNKSAFIDRLIREEIKREVEQYLFEQEKDVPVNLLAFIKKFIKIKTK